MSEATRSVIHDLLLWPGLFFMAYAGMRMFSEKFDKKLKEPDGGDE